MVYYNNYLLIETMKRSLAENDFITAFRTYYLQKPMQSLLKRSGYKPTAHNPGSQHQSILPNRDNRVPTWLRTYLFCASLLKPLDQEFLSSLPLESLPNFIFTKDYSINKLRELSVYFRLFSLGVSEEIIKRVMQNAHNPECVQILLAHSNPTENYKDVVFVLKRLTANTLYTFLTSNLYERIKQLKGANVYFLGWAAIAQISLTSVMNNNPEFFADTIANLFQLVTVNVKFVHFNNLTANLATTYFDLIRCAFAHAYSNHFLPRALLNNFFDARCTILPQLISRDPSQIPVMSLTKRHNKNEKEDWADEFIQFYSEPADRTNQHFLLYFFTPKAREILKKLKYLQDSYFNWLAKSSHRHYY